MGKGKGRNSGIWWGRGVGKVHIVGLGGRRGSEGIGGNKEVGEVREGRYSGAGWGGGVGKVHIVGLGGRRGREGLGG